MASGVFSKLLAFGTTSVVANKIVYTTPAAHTTIVKSATLTSSGATAMAAEMSVSSPSGAVAPFARANLTQYIPVVVDTWTVLPPGWRLVVLPSLAQTLYYVVSGSELDGEPDFPTVPTMGIGIYLGDVAVPLPVELGADQSAEPK